MNKLEVSDKYSLEYKNDYFITHEHAVSEKGNKYISKSQTYTNLIDAWSQLKKEGENGEKVMQTGRALLDAHRAAVYQEYLKEKERKKKAKSKSIKEGV